MYMSLKIRIWYVHYPLKIGPDRSTFCLNIFFKLTNIWTKLFLQTTEVHLVAKEVSVTAGMNKCFFMHTKTIFPGHKLTVILQTV